MNKHPSAILALTIALGLITPALAQTDEIKLDQAQAKITTVSAMRARRAPQVTAEEVLRLKLGTVVNAVARSANQDDIGGKTDYWYRVNLPNGQTGWVFGGLLLDYNAIQRKELLRQIIEARLKAENTDFADRQEIYNLRLEGDEVCHFFRIEGEIRYLSLHPKGAHAAEALKDFTEGLTDDVIRRANNKGGDRYAVEERTMLRKILTSLRLAVAKTSAPEKTELLKRLKRITFTR